MTIHHQYRTLGTPLKQSEIRAQRTNYTMAQLNDLEGNRRFVLSYNKKIERPNDLLRSGHAKRPITSLRYATLSSLRQCSNTPRILDFLIDDTNGYVIPNKSSGTFFSQYTINNMKDQSNIQHRFFLFWGLPVRA